MSQAKGLIVSVYSNPRYRGCANGGLSERFEELTLIGPKVSGPFEPNPETRPAIVLRSREVFGKVHVYAEPAENPTGGRFMMGGSYIGCSDSRFGEAVEAMGGISGVAIQFHDRQER